MIRSPGWATCGVITLACAVSLAAAQPAIQKCVDATGKIVYQDSPCLGGQKAVGQVQRDLAKPDPAALQRALDDRERASRMERARLQAAAAESEAARKRLDQEPEDPQRDPPIFPSPQPTPLFPPPGTGPGGAPVARPIPSSPSTGTMPLPGITQSPAPCTTAECRKK